MKTTVEKLFDISYGQKIYDNKGLLEGEEGLNMIISSTGDNNGVYGFYDIKNGYAAPLITVPRTGTIGQAFVQLQDCSVDANCLVLKPKSKLRVEELFQVAFQIRMNKWRYKYGRQITPKKLGQQEVVLGNIGTDFEKTVRLLMPKAISKITINENKNIKLTKIFDLCKIVKKIALPQNAINNNGSVPYVTTTSNNNGISSFVDEDSNFKGKCLTVAMNGSVGEVFFSNG